MSGAAPPVLVAIDAGQAETMLHQLIICGYLLRDGGDPVRAALRGTLAVTSLEQPVDVEGFLDALGHTRRYLDARLAGAHRRARQAVDRVGG